MCMCVCVCVTVSLACVCASFFWLSCSCPCVHFSFSFRVSSSLFSSCFCMDSWCRVLGLSYWLKKIVCRRSERNRELEINQINKGHELCRMSSVGISLLSPPHFPHKCIDYVTNRNKQVTLLYLFGWIMLVSYHRSCWKQQHVQY